MIKPTKTPPSTSTSSRRPSFHRSKSSSSSLHEEVTEHVDFFLDNRLPMDYFKQDILKLAHNLGLAHWKSITFPEMATDIVVSRISGAMTNAIYRVEPPPYLKDLIKAKYYQDHPDYLGSRVPGRTYHHRMPNPLLLRVYGPNVDQLIDREQELKVLSRLSLRKIGPRMLGTFTNGRFEQFLNAHPLTRMDLRDPDTSVQIAKRMRELHDNIAILDDERERGPAAFYVVDGWMNSAIDILNKIEASEGKEGVRKIIQTASISKFKQVIEGYWKYLLMKYSDLAHEKKSLVFCHNDTQYGNLLRIDPPKGSPLLQPANEHRQLIVIDFEYSAPNVRGYDIANHFCEWMADYHSSDPHHLREEWFPSLEEQLNLIQGYVEHGVAEFDDDLIDKQTNALLKEARDWRPAVNLHWAIWGVIQGLDNAESEKMREELGAQQSYTFSLSSSPDSAISIDQSEGGDDAADVDNFRYFDYASEKAQLFWTDLIELKLVDPKDYEGIYKYCEKPGAMANSK